MKVHVRSFNCNSNRNHPTRTGSPSSSVISKDPPTFDDLAGSESVNDTRTLADVRFPAFDWLQLKRLLNFGLSLHPDGVQAMGDRKDVEVHSLDSTDEGKCHGLRFGLSAVVRDEHAPRQDPSTVKATITRSTPL